MRIATPLFFATSLLIACKPEPPSLNEYERAKSCFVSIWSSSAAALVADPDQRNAYDEGSNLAIRYMQKAVVISSTNGKKESDIRRELLNAALSHLEKMKDLKGDELRSEFLEDLNNSKRCVDRIDVWASPDKLNSN